MDPNLVLLGEAFERAAEVLGGEMPALVPASDEEDDFETPETLPEPFEGLPGPPGGSPKASPPGRGVLAIGTPSPVESAAVAAAVAGGGGAGADAGVGAAKGKKKAARNPLAVAGGVVGVVGGVFAAAAAAGKKKKEKRGFEVVPAEDRGEAGTSGATAPEVFLPAKKFAGAKPGYVFTSGARGMGYYLDVKGKKTKAEKTAKGMPAIGGGLPGAAEWGSDDEEPVEAATSRKVLKKRHAVPGRLRKKLAKEKSAAKGR